MFRPSYISANRIRPAFDASFAAVPITLVPGKKVVLVVADNCDLDDETGVSLLAVNAFTHSYDQNARQAFLPILQRSGNQITGEKKKFSKFGFILTDGFSVLKSWFLKVWKR